MRSATLEGGGAGASAVFAGPMRLRAHGGQNAARVSSGVSQAAQWGGVQQERTSSQSAWRENISYANRRERCKHDEKNAESSESGQNATKLMTPDVGQAIDMYCA